MSSYPNITNTNLELTPMQCFWSPYASKIVATAPVASPGVVTATGSAYANGDRVVFVNSVGGTLPAPLIPYKPYWVVGASADTFEVATSPSGSALAITAVATGAFTVQKEIDLGATLKNVVITAKYTKADLKADQFGDTVLDRRVKGIDISVKTSLAEIRNKDIWKVAFPNITLLKTGGSAVRWDTKIGEKDTDLTGILRLHPMSENNEVLSFDYLMYQAVASSESTITYGPSEQAHLDVVWTMLPDESVSPARFFEYGDIGATT